MQAATQIKATPAVTHAALAKPRQPAMRAPTVDAIEAPVQDTQQENGTRLSHNFGAISVFPPDPPSIQPKRMVESAQHLSAFRPLGQNRANLAPVIPAGWAVPPRVQAKLTVGQPNDSYEQEADRVADQVVQRLAKTDAKAANKEQLPEWQKSPISSVGGDEGLQMKCAACAAEEESGHVQAKGNSVHRIPHGKGGVPASLNIESQLNSSKGGGHPLANNTRTTMEAAIGADFSKVRVHTGSNAVQMSQALNAQAFTHGSDVYFNQGKYNPSATEGSRLLAHELVHTVQQGAIQSKTIQRMIACPTRLNDSDPIPFGWRAYPGPTAVFHCGFRTILENRAPTPDDPMNECVYDHAGVLVDATHQYAGCRGTPDQYDSRIDPIRHAISDSGGIVAQGFPAFITSRVYDISTTIAAVVAVPKAMLNAIGSLLAQSILTGQAICTPSNWTYHTTMPSRSRAHLNMIGAILSSISLSGNLDNFLTNLSKPLGYFPIAQLPTEIATDVNTVLRNMRSQETISADVIRRLSLFQLVDWLKEHGVISYNRPPEEIAREQMQLLLGEQHP